MSSARTHTTTRVMMIGGAIVILLILVVLVVAQWIREQDTDNAVPLSTSPRTASKFGQDFIYGRLTTVEGDAYQGPLRWGRKEEAFWGHYFNGVKDKNPWAARVPPQQLTERHPLKIFGLEIAQRELPIDLGRPFMARFGDITRIEADGLNLHVSLKSGTVFHLDRLDADDLADGVRVWDERYGVMDFDEWGIRSIELLPSPHRGELSDRLHGTVRTKQGSFTGFVQWDREECVGTDPFDIYASSGQVFRLRFDSIRSIVRNSHDSTLVTLFDGREILSSDTREFGYGNRGIYVDDRRYGCVLVSWDAFEGVDFTPAGRGPSYSDFPQGRPIMGSVTSLAARHLTGRLVYDLDESETTETLDASSRGVTYNIPFGLISSIASSYGEDDDVPGAQVILHSGEELQFERAGDLSEKNAGVLIFVSGRERSEYVPWRDIERLDFDRPGEMYPPLNSSP